MVPEGHSNQLRSQACPDTGGLAASEEGRPYAGAGRAVRAAALPWEGDLLARMKRRPAGVEAAGARWPRWRLRAAPGAGRALVPPSSGPPCPGESGGPGARAEPLPGEGAVRPRGSGGGESQAGLMSKSMPFLGASLCSSPSSSKANRLPRVDFLSLRKVSVKRVSARNRNRSPTRGAQGQRDGSGISTKMEGKC